VRRVLVGSNVFVSFFIGHNAAQHAAARSLMQSAEDGTSELHVANAWLIGAPKSPLRPTQRQHPGASTRARVSRIKSGSILK
jgi:predicted nucleic acid-binding protein